MSTLMFVVNVERESMLDCVKGTFCPPHQFLSSDGKRYNPVVFRRKCPESKRGIDQAIVDFQSVTVCNQLKSNRLKRQPVTNRHRLHQTHYMKKISLDISLLLLGNRNDDVFSLSLLHFNYWQEESGERCFLCFGTEGTS